MSLIEIKNLTFGYNDEKTVIKNISFNIEKGSYTAIIGHNGSGKSTLAKLMSGLLVANKGEIIVDGLKLNEENIYSIREKLGIVFQNPDNQFIGSTVRDDIAFGLENRQVPSENMEEIIQKYAQEVGVSHLLDKEPSALSGGQKQRVAIAGIMAMKPDILIFDEATSMLDPKGKKDIKALMSKIHKEEKFTVISITHDIEEVLLADDCLVLNKGEVFMHELPENVFKRAEDLRKIDLDIPFNQKIKESFRNRGIRLKNDDLKGMAKELWQLSSNR